MNPALILELLPAAITTIENLTQWVSKVTTDLKQNAELTPDQEKALDAHIASIEQQPWWQPQD